MVAYLIRRSLQSLLLIWIVLTITFFLMHLAPGDPMARYDHPDISPETVRMMREQLGLDRPVMEQYFRWAGSFVKGDFGTSLRYNRPVGELLRIAIPNTLRLTVASLFLYMVIGIMLGMVSAARRYSVFDRLTTVISLFLYSVPSFWLALMLILFFSLKLGVLPSSHMQSLDVSGLSGLQLSADRLSHLILPAFVLGVASAAGLARYMRGSMLDVLKEDYIRTARAKGLPEGRVLMKHAFRNAAIPVVTILGLSLPFLLGGAVIVEKIFSWPGMGGLMVDAIYSRDYPVVLAINFVVAVMVILGNLLADTGYALLDPRISTGRRGR
ncbi:MAG: ABC transporter permease [Bacteroidales bacterium]|nr:ABC transporter permease [Candidatus Latescibacterota bacterium]